MANDIVTLKDHDLRSLIEQLSESRAAVAELVEALQAFVTAFDNDANYFGDECARAQSLLSLHQAGLGKGAG